MSTRQVWIFALVCFAVVTFYAFDRVQLNGVEDAALYNAVYMVAEHGKSCYPIYDDFNPGNWESMYTHPPFHYYFLGLAHTFFSIRTSVIVYHLLLVVALFITVLYTRWGNLLKAFVLAGIAGFLLTILTAEYRHSFQIRPETAIALQWLISIMLLQNAWQNPHKPIYLLLGSAFYTLMSITHYFAIPSYSALLIFWCGYFVRYAGPYYRRLLFTAVAVSAGILLFYFVKFIYPNLYGVAAITLGTQMHNADTYALNSLWDKLKWHLQVHHILFPVGLTGVAGLLLFKRTRLLACLAAPMVVLLTFYLNVKKSYYLVPEQAIFSIMLGVAAYWVVTRLLKLPDTIRPTPQSGYAVLFLPLCIVTMWWGSFSYPSYTWMEVMRKASQGMVGTNARVSGSHALWYVSGATEWRNEELRMLDHPVYNKSEIFESSDFLAIGPMLYYYDSLFRPNAAFACGEAEFCGLVLADLPFVLYGSKQPLPNATVAYCLKNNTLVEYVRSDRGNYTVGAILGYHAVSEKSAYSTGDDYPDTDELTNTMWLPYMDQQLTIRTYLNDSSAGIQPTYTTFFIGNVDSVSALKAIIAKDTTHRREIVREYRAVKRSSGANVFMGQPPKLNPHLQMKRFAKAKQ